MSPAGSPLRMIRRRVTIASIREKYITPPAAVAPRSAIPVRWRVPGEAASRRSPQAPGANGTPTANRAVSQHAPPARVRTPSFRASMSTRRGRRATRNLFVARATAFARGLGDIPRKGVPHAMCGFADRGDGRKCSLRLHLVGQTFLSGRQCRGNEDGQRPRRGRGMPVPPSCMATDRASQREAGRSGETGASRDSSSATSLDGHRSSIRRRPV